MTDQPNDEPEIAGEIYLRHDNPFGLPEGMHNLVRLVKLAQTNEQATFILEMVAG